LDWEEISRTFFYTLKQIKNLPNAILENIIKKK
jgi:hypothetical protein